MSMCLRDLSGAEKTVVCSAGSQPRLCCCPDDVNVPTAYWRSSTDLIRLDDAISTLARPMV